MKTGQFPILRTATGEPKIYQDLVHGIDVSYNPDDSLFYVHDADEAHTVIARFKDWRNVVQYTRKLATSHK